ncbi:tRNA(Ile)-lysidine synthase [Botrimarina colliarenosi]|uniref:tRNA(Ile)-lysidine synthase n=2 Tax=Botrimarina colliarenosi TaxID=2528001 RepID=A0A5C6AJS8_9BACT|nr:tRNA(Ile)-lysidine synthase [Botrimarina colliarenosi]
MQDRASPTRPQASLSASSDTLLSPRLSALAAEASPPELWRDVRVAVAVSGGADSVALFRWLLAEKQAGGGRGDVVVLHYDHRVRGDQSEADASWVAKLAAAHDARCVAEAAPIVGPRSEEALRDERRGFYRRATDELGARYLATGHTADDQAETVLFRLLRGAGPRGAAGIRATAPLSESCTLVRPLLGATRDDVLAYLADLRQPYREDVSNADDAYTRNWLRGAVLPLLAERFPAVRQDLAAFATRAAETADLVATLAESLLDGALLVGELETEAMAENAADSVTLQTALFAQSPRPLVTEALRAVWRRARWPQQAMTARHWRQLTDLATQSAPAAAVILPGKVRVERRDDRLTLARPPSEGSC